MIEPLWTSEEAARATGGKAIGQWSAHGISIDTRSLKEGDLFIALKDVRDGHDFVGNAYEKGAAACLVSKPVEGAPALIVDDTLSALEKLGLAARARSETFACAITGSVGKTSVKEMLAQIFRAFGAAHWSEKSFNNHFGVPVTLARMARETKRAVFEIGMSTPGEIEPRSKMVRPHAALITKIAPAHLEGLGSEEAVAVEKSDIFAGLEAGGIAILPAKDRFFEVMKKAAADWQAKLDFLRFGSDDSDAFVMGSDSDGFSTTFQINLSGEIVSTTIDAIGDHWGENVCAALLLAKCSGLSAKDAAHALNGYAPPAGRGTAEKLALADGGEFLLIDDAYNANPESMRAALLSFAARPAARRLIALGEMKELGADADQLHAELAEHVMGCDPAHVFLAGAGIKPLANALSGRTRITWNKKASDIQESLNKSLITGDALLIKGSNASGMRLLAEEIRKWSENNKSSATEETR